MGTYAMTALGENLSEISSYISLTVFSCTGVVICAFIWMLRLTRTIWESFSSVLDSFEKIDESDVKKIVRYCTIILSHFKYAIEKEDWYSSL